MRNLKKPRSDSGPGLGLFRAVPGFLITEHVAFAMVSVLAVSLLQDCVHHNATTYVTPPCPLRSDPHTL